ncbi:MAG: TonB-dependent receptor [Opitutales bacterium]|nr:TonB-dependent receptor [Opitutales bacterium]
MRPLPGQLCLSLCALGSLFAATVGLGDSPLTETEPPLELPPYQVIAAQGPQTTGLSSGVVRSPLPTGRPVFREALAPLPGLVIQDSFGGLEPPRISVRGSGLQSAPVSRGLQLSLNGFPATFADGSFNLGLLETSWWDYAELKPGPAAGVSALGGALSLWTDEEILPTHRRWLVGAGSYQTYYGSLGGGWHNVDHRLALVAGTFQTDGWRNHAQQDRNSFLINHQWNPSRPGRLLTQFLFSRPRLQIPGPLAKETALHSPKENIPRVETDRPHRDTRYGQAATRWQIPTDTGHLSLGTALAFHRDDFRQLLPNGITRTEGGDLHLFGDLRWEGKTFVPSTTDLNFLFQAGYREARRYRNQQGQRGPLIGDQRQKPLSFQAAVDHRLEITENHQWEAGFTFLGARRKLTERLPGQAGTPNDSSLNLQQTKVAPRTAWTWTFTENQSLTASLARSYEPPTFDDLVFTTGPIPARELSSRPLAWQRADSWELLWNSRQNTVDWTLRGFYSRWKNEFLRLAREDGTPRGTVNADRTLRYGLELSANWTIFQDDLREMTLQANAQSSRIRFDDDPVYHHNRLGGTPPHSGHLALVNRWENWFFTPSLQWQGGPTYADHQNSLSFGSHWLTNLAFGWEDPEGWSIRIHLLNLFDQDHIASSAGLLDNANADPSTTIFLPGPPRRLEIQTTHQW